MSNEESPDDAGGSLRMRRLREPFDDLPEMYPTVRERSQAERLSRHLQALRHRLDYLVRLEDRYGEEQTDVHRNRAERNGLIHAITALMPDAQRLAVPASPTPRTHSREYVQRVQAEIDDLLARGYIVVDERRPGVVLHKLGADIAPAEVSLTVWFGIAMAARAAAAPE